MEQAIIKWLDKMKYASNNSPLFTLEFLSPARRIFIFLVIATDGHGSPSFSAVAYLLSRP